jgi:hypothetical protein
MSALAERQRLAARGRIVPRPRDAGRSRRAGAGAVTEMARSLLHEAREAGVAQAGGDRREARVPRAPRALPRGLEQGERAGIAPGQ